jgi:hypothetical protein
MENFILAFIIMLIVVVIMAVGYIFQQKQIKGSCGGISDLGLEKVCDCDEPCDKRKELIKRMEEQQREEERIAITMVDE